LKAKKFVIASDNHGAQQHDASVEALFTFMAGYRPDVVVHAGDNWDFSQLRRGASDDERADSLQDDWDAGTQFFKRFFAHGKERHMLLGNHDDRPWQLLKNTTGLVRDYAEDGVNRILSMAKRQNVNLLPYHARAGVLRLGCLKVIHGYHVGVGAVRQHANIYGNCVFGHVHSIESYAVPGLEQREARAIGCLCKTDMDYIKAKTASLRWEHGWAYGVLFPDGSYQLWQAKEIGGKFYAAKDIEVF
jgi:hypothetical protein